MNQETAISIDNLSKCYHIYNKPNDRLKQLFCGKRKQLYRDFWALRDISFSLKKGEAFGIIGRNGCGKSTLLQLICRTLTPTTGSIETKGKIAALLELGSGFNPEFTGRENVYMNGAILGFSRKEIDARFAEIEAFADIGPYIDQPVKTYSSGMYVRLAFAVQVCVEPDILIVDEALSVGDIFFQQKCFKRIRELIAKNVTCLFVSHDTRAVMNICNKVMLLSAGQIKYIGDPEIGVSKYFAEFGKGKIKNSKLDYEPYMECKKKDDISYQEIFACNILNHSLERTGQRDMEIQAAKIMNNAGLDTLQVAMQKELHFYLVICAHNAIFDPSVGIHLYDRLGNLVFAAGSRQLRLKLPDMQKNDRLIVKLSVTFDVQPGEYTFSLGASEPSSEGANIGFIQDKHENLGPITVIADQNALLPFHGMAKLPLAISICEPT